MANEYGEIQIAEKTVFRYVIDRTARIPEICGWVEQNHDMVEGTYGFYRTADAEAACEIAKSKLN